LVRDDEGGVRHESGVGIDCRTAAGRSAVRFREDKPEDLARARSAVAEWRERHPQGTAEQLLADLDSQFHWDYGPVLRSMLVVVDRHHAREVRGRAAGAVR
jgi:hypothetical protein